MKFKSIIAISLFVFSQFLFSSELIASRLSNNSVVDDSSSSSYVLLESGDLSFELELFQTSATVDLIKRIKDGSLTELTFSDYASSEKISYIKPELDTSNMQGCKPSAGDVTIYKPWGNIAIFYKDGTSYNSSLVCFGKLSKGLENIDRLSGAFSIKIKEE